MKVRPAMELFSHSVAKALEYLFPKEGEMASFFQLVNDACDILNTRSKKPNGKSPFGMAFDVQVSTLDKFSKALTELRVFNRRPCIKPFQRGIKLTCESLKGLFQQLQ